jgi:Right handed beta helix region
MDGPRSSGSLRDGAPTGRQAPPALARTAYTTCVSITGSHIRNVRFGAVISGNNSLFSNNEIDHFGDDGIDYAASNISITHNTIHGNFDLGDGNHEDVMQGQNGALAMGVPYNSFSNILIDSNLVIRQTDPKLAFATYLQGIDAFDEDWTNVTVTNNVIITSSCWGIFYASRHSSKIIKQYGGGRWRRCGHEKPSRKGRVSPLDLVGDKTHEGPSSNGVIVRNNIASNLGIYNPNPNMTMERNICLAVNGKCQMNGKPDFGVFRPGAYGDHNLTNGRGAGGMFVSFDPAKLVYDVTLKPGGARGPRRQFRGSATGRHYGSPARGSGRHWRLPSGPDK